ncbi:MAG: helix-turn-helix transcriptional regulator [Fimbriimonadaceae bacterium]|nr:helix-turn-helix transcriptional regulator [Alphaproteobacteria bacterium]
MPKRRHNALANCPTEAALEVIGGKWKSLILSHLLMETKRFNELRRLLPNITQRMLTKQLRELEKDNLVRRKIYAEVPPRVEYSLTDLGRTLEPLINLLRAWGETHMMARVRRDDRTSAD